MSIESVVVLGARPGLMQDANVAARLQEARTAQQQAQAAQQAARAAQQDAAEAGRQAATQARLEVQRAMDELRKEMMQARQGEATVVVPSFPDGPQIPEAAVVISIAFFAMCAIIAIGVPIARAFARRMDRKHAVAPASDPDTRSRLERIEQAVDAIALEVERISEGQRFTSKLLAEFRALPQPDAAASLGERLQDRNADRAGVPVGRAGEPR